MPHLKISKNDDKDTCKGHKFRGKVNQYYHDGSIRERIELKLLKKLSCRGCEECGWFNETVSEVVSEVGINLSEIEEGRIYKLEPIFWYDWENGASEIEGFKAVEIKEK